MITKITPKQAKQIHKLVYSLCCNCDNDNCLLLDDGESHKCVQLISSTVSTAIILWEQYYLLTKNSTLKS